MKQKIKSTYKNVTAKKLYEEAKDYIMTEQKNIQIVADIKAADELRDKTRQEKIGKIDEMLEGKEMFAKSREVITLLQDFLTKRYDYKVRSPYKYVDPYKNLDSLYSKIVKDVHELSTLLSKEIEEIKSQLV